MIEVKSVKWLADQPFIGGTYQPWKAILYSDEYVSGNMGFWTYHAKKEGGWNHYEGQGEFTVQGESFIPSEQGTYTMRSYPLEWNSDASLWCDVLQNPDVLFPSGTPPTVENGNPIPIPMSPYVPYVDVVEINLPELSTDRDTIGEIVVQLLSPKNREIWKEAGEVGNKSSTEGRYQLINIHKVEVEYYSYWFKVGESVVTHKVLRPDDESGEFSLPLKFHAVTEELVPMTFRGGIHLKKTNGERVSYILYWGEKETDFLVEPLLANVHISKPFEGLTDEDIAATNQLISQCSLVHYSEDECVSFVTSAMSHIYPIGSEGSDAIQEIVVDFYNTEPPPKKSIEFDEGWNLIGWALDDRYVDSSLFDELPPLHSIMGYKEGEGNNGWTSLTRGWPDEVNTLSKLERGKGYWFLANEEFTWDIEYEDPSQSPYLKMTKAQLEQELASHRISDKWWGLLPAERTALAKRIIEWWSYPIKARMIDRGDKPDKKPWEYESPSKYPCACMCEAQLRYFLLGSNEGMSDSFWFYDERQEDWANVRPPHSFNLPVSLVAVDFPENNPGHWILALQIAKDKKKWDSWVFFQYQMVVIPGDPQNMPIGSKVRIIEVLGVTATSTQFWLDKGQTLAEFDNVGG